MSLKVLVDARSVGPHTHGIARYTLDLIKGLKKKGHHVAALTTTPIKDVEHQYHFNLPFAHPLEALELSLKNHARFYDIIHFTSFAVPLFMPKNSVVTIHDLIHLNVEPKFSHKLYYKSVVAPALRKSGQVITVSQWTKNQVAKTFNIQPQQISVVRNGISDFWSKPTAQKKPVSEPFFIALGNTKPHKNLKTLIEASSELWEQKENFKLVLSLGGANWPDDWPRAHQENIILLKGATDLELKNYFSSSLALVSTSLFEGFNYPAVEALACGTRAILSKGSAHDELQGPNVTFYGDPTDREGLKKSLKLLLRTDSQPAATQVQYVDGMIENTLQVYRTVLGKCPVQTL